jgi:hypothetical protein
MDPLSAFALAIKAVAEMVTELSRGQTVEQKQKMWEWYVTDVERLRKWFKLDG